MAYTKQIWENENPSSQLNETRLNHIEDGIANAYNVSLIAISGTAPSECSTGDMYYNTTDNKIYTATATDTWGEVGTTPISDKTYVLVTDNTTYAYLNGTLEQIGGSEQEVENEYSESTTLPYSCDYVNGKLVDLTIQTYSATVGSIPASGDKWGQQLTITIPEGYVAIGVVGYAFSGQYYSYLSFSEVYVNGDKVYFALSNSNNSHSAENVVCSFKVLLLKTY